MKAKDFKGMEKNRDGYLTKIRQLSLMEFDLKKWEELRKLVYKVVPLDVDVIIDDTTLREGVQMAGIVSPHPSDSCRIACLLRDIGVERLEVLTYTKSDQEAIKRMRDENLGEILAAWSRAAKEDIDLALKLDFKQIGISHPVSYIHFEKWADKPLEELFARITEAVEYAKDHGLTIFVHGEDSTRADWEFEKTFINAVADAGASVYRVCDTVGCGVSDPKAPLPHGIPAKVAHIKKETKIPYIEIHAHDDLGNAVENTMATVRAASGLYDKVYVSTTFLGLGDRAGGAETEKVILNCYLHHGIDKWNLSLLRELAKFIDYSTNFHLPVNKAIVGDSAFAHESGIHVHGISALPLTYEAFPPELVGHERTIVVGMRSGKHGVKLKLEELLKREVDENDPKLAEFVDLVKKKFVEGRRRYPIGEDEFRRLARKVGFYEI